MLTASTHFPASRPPARVLHIEGKAFAFGLEFETPTARQRVGVKKQAHSQASKNGSSYVAVRNSAHPLFGMASLPPGSVGPPLCARFTLRHSVLRQRRRAPFSVSGSLLMGVVGFVPAGPRASSRRATSFWPTNKWRRNSFWQCATAWEANCATSTRQSIGAPTIPKTLEATTYAYC